MKLTNHYSCLQFYLLPIQHYHLEHDLLAWASRPLEDWKTIEGPWMDKSMWQNRLFVVNIEVVFSREASTVGTWQGADRTQCLYEHWVLSNGVLGYESGELVMRWHFCSHALHFPSLVLWIKLKKNWVARWSKRVGPAN